MPLFLLLFLLIPFIHSSISVNFVPANVFRNSLVCRVSSSVGCLCHHCLVLFGHVKKRRRPHKKEIFICGDCWLLVFDFLVPSQLGLEIALISRRFDLRVDEHFKTRKWMLNKQLQIQWKFRENGTKEMQTIDADKGKALPIPQKSLPNKVIGFSKCITIIYIDQNVVAFLHRFHSFFATSAMDLDIITENGRILEFVLHNIWPMFRDSMRHLFLNATIFHRMCQLDPSMLSDCPSLRYVYLYDAAICDVCFV